MKLYHGTSLTSANMITDTEEFQPQKFKGADQSFERLKAKEKGEYKGFTFLATTEEKAKYYSNYVNHHREFGALYEVIFEIELDESLLLPDNDDYKEATNWQESAKRDQQVKVEGNLSTENIKRVHIYETFGGEKVYSGDFSNWQKEFENIRFNHQEEKRDWYKVVSDSKTFKEMYNENDGFEQKNSYEKTSVSLKDAILLGGEVEEKAFEILREEVKKHKEEIKFKKEFTIKPPFFKVSTDEIKFNQWMEGNNDVFHEVAQKQEVIKDITEKTNINVFLEEIHPRKEKDVFLHRGSVEKHLENVTSKDEIIFPIELNCPFFKENTPEVSEVEKGIFLTKDLKIPYSFYDSITVTTHKPNDFKLPVSFETKDEFLAFANNHFHFGIEKSSAKYDEATNSFSKELVERENTYKETLENTKLFIEKKDINSLQNIFENIDDKKLKKEVKIMIVDTKLDKRQIFNQSEKENAKEELSL